MNFAAFAYNALFQVFGVVLISVHNGWRNVPVKAAVLTEEPIVRQVKVVDKARLGTSQIHDERKSDLCNPVLSATPGLPPQAAEKSPLSVASLSRTNEGMFMARLHTPLCM